MVFSVHDKTNGNDIYAFYDGQYFIGFSSIAIYKDMLYVSYLAIVKEKRNMGYGTKILDFIKDTYQNYVILLSFEEVDKKYPDYESRLKRMNFYYRNGFINNHLKTKEGPVIYQSAYIGKHQVLYKDYIVLFNLVYGNGANKLYLRKVSK